MRIDLDAGEGGGVYIFYTFTRTCICLVPLQWMTIVADDDGGFCKGEMIRCGLFSILQV
jgi:hypothetical protein